MNDLAHVLTLGPLKDVHPGTAVHVLPPKMADTPTLECPCCGMKLFVYYRHYGLVEGDERARKEEGNEE